MKKIVFIVTSFFILVTSYGQTVEELKADQVAKKDSITAIQARVDALQGQIDAFPGWKKGAFGTIGGSFTGFNNWYGQKTPNNRSGNIGFTGNAFANLDKNAYFWRNAANINLSIYLTLLFC